MTSSFRDLGLPSAVADALAAAGFAEPLPVQRDAIPPAIAGRDVVVSAETGSGKTLAYLAPVVSLLTTGSGARCDTPRALIMTPTRELAAQVDDVARRAFGSLGLRTVLLAGGTKVAPQAKALDAGCDLVIATPGRLRDLARRGHFKPDRIEAVVLDEADRMLDLGFLPHVRRCLALLPLRRQTLLFSATIPAEIAALADEMLRTPERIRAEQDDDHPVPPGIVHRATFVRQPLKRLLLLHLITSGEVGTALVFTSSRFRAGALARWLKDEGVDADSLHGGRSQEDRDAALLAFREQRLRVLIATDLAERGLDLPELTHVVNFDLPHQPETYAHRVGRTARAFGEGTAVTLAAPPEKDALAAIATTLGLEIPLVTSEGFDFDQKPQGLDPLVPREDLRRKDEERAAREAEVPKWKKGNPTRQKAAFWERARDARKKKPKPPRPRRKR